MKETCTFFLQIAAEVAAPLSKTDTIVMVGDDRTTSEVSRLVSQLPPAVQALTGIDLSKVSNEPKSQNLKKNCMHQYLVLTQNNLFYLQVVGKIPGATSQNKCGVILNSACFFNGTYRFHCELCVTFCVDLFYTC